MPGDNRCVYMAHACFHACCSACVVVCGYVFGVTSVVKDIGIFALECWSMFCVYVGGVREIVFYVWIVARGAVVFVYGKYECVVMHVFVSCVHPVAVLNVASYRQLCCGGCFLKICIGLCACTEMVWMYVLYVSFGSKVRPRTFVCIAMGCVMFLFLPHSSHGYSINCKTRYWLQEKL